jgi:acetylglutamate kinase
MPVTDFFTLQTDLENTLDQAIHKAKILTEALPYIQRFHQKTFVIKYGGSTMNAESQAILSDIALLKSVGINAVIVHGGGAAINHTLKQLGKEPVFKNGLRVTDDETMTVVEMVLAGQINKGIVSALQRLGIQALGVSGKDMDLLQASKKLVDGVDVGHVGHIQQVNSEFLAGLLAQGITPVIAPIGTDEVGQSYNINADDAAIAIAAALKAEKLVFLTDVPGVMRDIHDPSSLLSRLSVQEAENFIRQGVIQGGMIPKVTSAIDGIREGIGSVHILDGRVLHTLLLEIFTDQGVGTMLVAEETDG